jgi:hypothetical protein
VTPDQETPDTVIDVVVNRLVGQLARGHSLSGRFVGAGGAEVIAARQAMITFAAGMPTREPRSALEEISKASVAISVRKKGKYTDVVSVRFACRATSVRAFVWAADRA